MWQVLKKVPLFEFVSLGLSVTLTFFLCLYLTGGLCVFLGCVFYLLLHLLILIFLLLEFCAPWTWPTPFLELQGLFRLT